MNIKNYKYKWDNMDWFLDPSGSNEVKKKLDHLKQYLTFERKQSMSRYEARLYDWILKKQYKADPIELIEWSEVIDSDGWAHREKINQQYYLGYYRPIYRNTVPSEYAKEQQKHRSRFHSKMGR